MKVIARKFIGYADLQAPMSSPGDVLVELELKASCRDDAIAECASLGVGYVMPVVELRPGPRLSSAPVGDDPAPELLAIARAGELALRDARIAKAVALCRAAAPARKTQVVPRRPHRRPANAKRRLVPGQGYAKVPK